MDRKSNEEQYCNTGVKTLEIRPRRHAFQAGLVSRLSAGLRFRDSHQRYARV
jgi:hypothetical protein